MTLDENIKKLQIFFDKPLSKAGIEPLKKGIELHLELAGLGPATFVRTPTGVEIVAREAKKPDLSISIPQSGIDTLLKLKPKDEGDLGIELLKLIAHPEAERRVHVKIHVGIAGFLQHGYLGIVGLGGKKLMKFLAEKGLGSIQQVIQAISRMKKD